MAGSFELDHVFVAASVGAPEIQFLASAGFTEGLYRDHPGQGTASRGIFFSNIYLELIWLTDAQAARTPPVRRTCLAERVDPQEIGVLCARVREIAEAVVPRDETPLDFELGSCGGEQYERRETGYAREVAVPIQATFEDPERQPDPALTRALIGGLGMIAAAQDWPTSTQHLMNVAEPVDFMRSEDLYWHPDARREAIRQLILAKCQRFL